MRTTDGEVLGRRILLGVLACAVLFSICAHVALFKGCFHKAKARTKGESQIYSRTMAIRCEVFTLEHDGHSFVVHSGGGLLHHPDCPKEGKE